MLILTTLIIFFFNILLYLSDVMSSNQKKKSWNLWVFRSICYLYSYYQHQRIIKVYSSMKCHCLFRNCQFIIKMTKIRILSLCLWNGNVAGYKVISLGRSSVGRQVLLHLYNTHHHSFLLLGLSLEPYQRPSFYLCQVTNWFFSVGMYFPYSDTIPVKCIIIVHDMFEHVQHLKTFENTMPLL